MATPYDFARGSAMMGSFANQQQYTREMPRPTQDRWSGNWGTGASQNSYAPAQQRATNFPARNPREQQFGVAGASSRGGWPVGGGYPGMNQGQANDLASRMGWNSTYDPSRYASGRNSMGGGYAGGGLTTGALNALGLSSNDYQNMLTQHRTPSGGGYGGGGYGGGQYGGGGPRQTGFSNPYNRAGSGQAPPQYSPYSSGGGVNRPDISGFMAGNDLNTSQNALPWYTAAENQAQNQIANNQWDQTFNWQQQGDIFNMGQTATMNDFSKWMGGEQMNLAYGDQALNEWSLGNQHEAAMAGIALGYYGADQNYNLGMEQTQNQFDLGMANVGLGYHGANQQYGLGMRNADINEMNYNNQFTLGMTNADINRMNYENQYKLGMTNADINRMNVQGQLGLGQGQLDWQRYNTDTTAGLTRDQMANDLFLGKGNLALGQGQLDWQRYNTDTTAGLTREQMANDLFLGKGNLGVAQGDLALRGELGRKEFGLSQELGRGQLGISQGMLGVSQGELALSGELGRGDLGLRTSQQSLDEAYRRSALQQQAELERESLQNQLTQSRYAAFGRAQAPNVRMNRSW